MRQVTIELEYDVKEVRTYDETDRLIDIRKVFPAHSKIRSHLGATNKSQRKEAE